MKTIWPKERDRVSTAIVERLGELCITAGDCFPEAVVLVRDWLVPVRSPHGLVNRLQDSALCERFPVAAAALLGQAVGVVYAWMPRALKVCLEVIASQTPELRGEPEFVQLRGYWQAV